MKSRILAIVMTLAIIGIAFMSVLGAEGFRRPTIPPALVRTCKRPIVPLATSSCKCLICNLISQVIYIFPFF